MFVNYRIINNVLCLYVDDKYEFASFKKTNKGSLKREIIDYIKRKKIKYNGTKVILLLSGLMIGSVILNNDYNKSISKEDNYKYVYNVSLKNNYASVDKEYDPLIEISEENVLSKNEEMLSENININNSKPVVNNASSKENTVYDNKAQDENNMTKEETVDSNDDIKINVLRKNGDVINISLTDYIIGVVASEMPASFNSEALKSQAIVSRTYTLKLMEAKRTITDDNRTQNYKDNNELKALWNEKYDEYYNKIKSAVLAVGDLKIKYNGNLIEAVYHSTSNGYTQDSYNVWNNSYDYLKSVASPWDTSASSFLREKNISFEDISKLLNIDFNSSQSIEIISKDESNRIARICFNDKSFSGVDIRNLLSLRSCDFDFEILDGYVKFTTRGYGHGVGLSQYGANGMANAGYKYDDIIKYYYTGVYIE